MKSSSKVEQYWSIVERCLEELYGMPHERARMEIEKRTVSSSSGRPRDMIFHAPPLHVASNIAGEDKPMSDETWNGYLAILKRYDLDPSGLEADRVHRKTVSASKMPKPQQALATR